MPDTQPPNYTELAVEAVATHHALQDPAELAQLLEVVAPVIAGRTVLEIGCDRGGSLWLWSQLAARVVAVTLPNVDERVFSAHGATVVRGNSTSAHARWGARRQLRGESPAMVFVDGGHDSVTAASDIAWACYLVDNGLVVIHDIVAHMYADWSHVDQAWGPYRLRSDASEIVREPGQTPGYGVIDLRGGDAVSMPSDRALSARDRYIAGIRRVAESDLADARDSPLTSWRRGTDG